MENGLYKHPLWQIVGDKDPHCSALDNRRLVAMYRDSPDGQKVQSIRIAWHSDISFEPNPPDFSSLRLTDLPIEGGGTTPNHAIPLPIPRSAATSQGGPLTIAQIHCGLLVMKYTTAFPNPCRPFWRVSQPHTLKRRPCKRRLVPREKALKKGHVELQLMLVPQWRPSIQSYVLTQ